MKTKTLKAGKSAFQDAIQQFRHEYAIGGLKPPTLAMLRSERAALTARLKEITYQMKALVLRVR